MSTISSSQNILDIDCEKEVERITSQMRDVVSKEFRRRGVVVALSGGVDSSVCAALCAEAFGSERVLALFLPEKDSSMEITNLGKVVADMLALPWENEDISPVLEKIGCYRWRDDAIRQVFPDYGSDWKNKIVIRGAAGGKFHFFYLVVQSPDGCIYDKRLPHDAYLQIVAATNYKQRIRKTIEYFHADRLNYAVVGTPNRLEYDQGFFVKNGDGSADIKPIAHLYKTQVYQLARYLKLPEEICNAVPTTDTYSLPQTQDEFYFSLPYHQMDVALWGYNHGMDAGKCAALLGLKEADIEAVYGDIAAKRKTTKYLHEAPRLISSVLS